MSVAGPDMPLSVMRVAWPEAVIVIGCIWMEGAARAGARVISETAMINAASAYSLLSTGFISFAS